MYVAVVPNRKSPPAVLLREAFRQDGKVRNRTLANLSHWPPEQIEALRQVLKGDYSHMPVLDSAFQITRTLALITGLILETASRLATSRSLRPETCHHTLGAELELGALNEDDLYAGWDFGLA